MSKRNAVTTFFTNRVTKALGMTLALMMTCQSAMASLAADQTRYIFRGDKDALTITVTNNDKERTFGGQAWVDNIVEKDTRPTFVVTPSFFKVKPNGQQTLRIIMASDHLPKDKESVYWLNLQDNLLYVTDRSLQTLQYVLYQVINSSEAAFFIDAGASAETVAASLQANTQNTIPTPEVVKMTVMVVVTFPILMVYPFFQKYFIKGMLVGAVKA